MSLGCLTARCYLVYTYSHHYQSMLHLALSMPGLQKSSNKLPHLIDTIALHYKKTSCFYWANRINFHSIFPVIKTQHESLTNTNTWTNLATHKPPERLSFGIRQTCSPAKLHKQKLMSATATKIVHCTHQFVPSCWLSSTKTALMLFTNKKLYYVLFCQITLRQHLIHL